MADKRHSSAPPASLIPTLRSVFGLEEAVGWEGSWMLTPTAQEMLPDDPYSPEAPGFPFHTWAAGLVWKTAKQMIAEHPEYSPYEVLDQSVAMSTVRRIELTPEDVQLLRMAIDQEVTRRGRTAGTPGVGMPFPGR